MGLRIKQNSTDAFSLRACNPAEFLRQESRSQRVFGMGALLSLCTPLLGTLALAIWPRGNASHGTRHRGPVALLGGMGILAFVLSAISTCDNNFHHRYVGGRKSLRVSGRGLTRVSADGIPSHMAAPVPFARPRLPRPEGITQSLSIATNFLPGMLPPAACASRAPPLPL